MRECFRIHASLEAYIHRTTQALSTAKGMASLPQGAPENGAIGTVMLEVVLHIAAEVWRGVAVVLAAFR